MLKLPDVFLELQDGSHGAQMINISKGEQTVYNAL